MANKKLQHQRWQDIPKKTRVPCFGSRLTPSTSSRAFRPGQIVPGEAHFVVTASSSLDGHNKPVADTQVLFLEEDLQ